MIPIIKININGKIKKARNTVSSVCLYVDNTCDQYVYMRELICVKLYAWNYMRASTRRWICTHVNLCAWVNVYACECMHVWASLNMHYLENQGTVLTFAEYANMFPMRGKVTLSSTPNTPISFSFLRRTMQTIKRSNLTIIDFFEFFLLVHQKPFGVGHT